MNKNIIIILIVAVVAAAVYYFYASGNKKVVEVEQNTATETAGQIEYVGLNIDEAEAQAQEQGVQFRVVEEDGQTQPTTKDLQAGRVNATVENGVVTTYTVDPTNEQVHEETANHDELLGLTTAEAEAYAEVDGIDLRVVSIDGEELPVTLDLRPGRVNVGIENDVVTGYSVE